MECEAENVSEILFACPTCGRKVVVGKAVPKFVVIDRGDGTRSTAARRVASRWRSPSPADPRTREEARPVGRASCADLDARMRSDRDSRP